MHLIVYKLLQVENLTKYNLYERRLNSHARF